MGEEVGEAEEPELAVRGSEGGEGGDVVAGADGGENLDDREDSVGLEGHERGRQANYLSQLLLCAVYPIIFSI